MRSASRANMLVSFTYWIRIIASPPISSRFASSSMVSCAVWRHVDSPHVTAPSCNRAGSAHRAIFMIPSRVRAFMRTASLPGLIGLLLALCACGEQEANSRAQPIEDTAFAELTGTMDKARAVEDVASQRMKQLNEALDNQQDR